MSEGNWWIEFPPQAGEPPPSEAAVPGWRLGRPVLCFPANAERRVRFSGVLPSGCGGRGLVVRVWASFSADTDPEHFARLKLAWERLAVGEDSLDEESFGPAKAIVLPVPGNSGGLVAGTLVFVAGDEIDGLQAGELFRLQLALDPQQSVFTGDLELVRLVISEAI